MLGQVVGALGEAHGRGTNSAMAMEVRAKQ